MPRQEHNGEDFHYLVRYKRAGISGAEEITVKVPDVKVTDASRREYVVDGQETYKEYIISVQAANQEGLAPADSIERKFGYSGQGSKYSYTDPTKMVNFD
jgi:hypothetical protein